MVKKLNLKLAIATSAGAVLASQAQGAVVQSLTVGAGLLPPASSGLTSWDVDGDGTVDFFLRNYDGSSASFDDASGGRLVVPSTTTDSGILKLNSGFVVGNTMPGATFQTATASYNTITNSGSIDGDASNGGWAVGDTGFFGFRFTSAGSTHYGWGEMSITGTPIGQGFIINEAWYETTADAPITVGGAVPEPGSLGLLALGALGAACARRRRTAAAE